MLVRNHVESNKGISNLVTTLILVVIALGLVSVLWYTTKKIISTSPLETDFFCLVSDILIKRACYLNDDEIQVDVKRGVDELKIKKLEMRFFSLNETFIWVVSGEKCLDIRLKEKEYGSYCDILPQVSSFSYVFNFTDLPKQERVKLVLGTENDFCIAGEKEIKNFC